MSANKDEAPTENTNTIPVVVVSANLTPNSSENSSFHESPNSIAHQTGKTRTLPEPPKPVQISTPKKVAEIKSTKKRKNLFRKQKKKEHVIPVIPAPPENFHIYNGIVGLNSVPEISNSPIVVSSSSTPKNVDIMKGLVTPAGKQSLYYTIPAVVDGAYESKKIPVLSELNERLMKKFGIWHGLLVTIVTLLVMVGIGIYFSLSYPSSILTIAVIAAVIPFLILFGILMWLDRWSPLPLSIKMLTFLWGAAGSIALTMVIQLTVYQLFPVLATEVIGASILAPIIEEFAKVIGVIVICIIFRKRLHNFFDGIILVALSALGFSVTENILYFAMSYVDGGVMGLGMTFLLRAIVSPFAHQVFTLPMGFALGYVIARGLSWPHFFSRVALIYPLSVALHSMWNSASDVFSYGFLQWPAFYFLIQVPLFVIAVAVVFGYRKYESYATHKRLTEYSWAGWFTPNEVYLFSTWHGRRQIKKWAKAHNVTKLTSTILEDILILTALRDREVLFNNVDDYERKELVLLNSLAHNRNTLMFGS